MLVNSPFDSSSTKLTIFIKIATPNKRKHVQDRGKRSQKITIIKFNALGCFTLQLKYLVKLNKMIN